MGLLTAGKGLYDKTKKKKDLLSQTQLLTIMEKSGSSKEFMANMDDVLKNKEKQDIAMNEQLRVQQDRLNLSDAYLSDLPLEEGISQVKHMRTMIGAASIGLIEESASSYMDNQIMKQRDVTKAARFGNLKSAVNKTLGLTGSIFGGAVAGSIVPGVGNLAGAIVGGLAYVGKETISYFSNNAKEKFDIEQANKDAEIGSLTLGTIIYDGNRKSK